MAINNSMEISRGVGLETFLPAPRAFDEDEEPGEEEPACCVGLFDQESVQWAVANFLVYKLQGQFLFLFGPMHRRDNDVTRAIAASGHFMVLLCSMMCGNVPHGSWHNKAFYASILETAWEACIA
eukprot:3209662-Lingulodinium_polyedra.AAC.1